MKMKWTALKRVIAGFDTQPGMFLTLVNEEGSIICANANMIRSLHLQNPRKSSVSFLDLLHPFNLEQFREGLTNCKENATRS
jgi:hypothetical protein